MIPKQQKPRSSVEHSDEEFIGQLHRQESTTGDFVHLPSVVGIKRTSRIEGVPKLSDSKLKPSRKQKPLLSSTVESPYAASVPNPRKRKRHDLSDGESDNEDSNILYRSLRPDENPFKNGLKPPAGFDSNITASHHITSGSKLKTPSKWISTTRSFKVASAWASKIKNGRVVKIRKPTQDQAESFDLTNPEEARRIFPNEAGSSLNSAKSSQEVLIDQHVSPDNILAVYGATRVTVARYKAATSDSEPGLFKKIRSRTVAQSSPIPVLLFPISKPEPTFPDLDEL